MAKYRITPSSKAIIQLPISIGHKAEKGVEAIEFDLTAWVEAYGSGTLTVIMRRWGDAIPYPIALEIDGNNKATWTLSDTDTAKAGMAYAQLSYIVGETVVKKSDIYTFRVMDSLTGEGEPPEAYESWLEHLTHLAAEAMAEVLDIESIVTDKTLTVDGGIADAKATGDALSALEDQFTEETDKLKADLDVYNSVDVLYSLGYDIHANKGITYTRNKNEIVANGTVSSDRSSYAVLFDGATNFPDGLNGNTEYNCIFETNDNNVKMEIYGYDSSAIPRLIRSFNNGSGTAIISFTGYYGALIRSNIAPNTVVSNAVFSCSILSSPSNEELKNLIELNGADIDTLNTSFEVYHSVISSIITNVEVLGTNSKIVISNIRRAYNGSTGFTIYASNDSGDALSVIADVSNVTTLTGQYEGFLFGTDKNAKISFDYDLTILSVGQRYSGQGKNYLVARKCYKVTMESLYGGFGFIENFAVIGDSYASGEIYTPADNEQGYSAQDYYNLSWGQILARKNGVTCINLSKGGLTTRSWLTDSMGLSLLNSEQAQNLYFCALGINDKAKLGAGYVGTINDITNDSADTFFGNYGKIIRAIKEKAPNAKIVFITFAYSYDSLESTYNNAIKQIATYYELPCMDVSKYSFFAQTSWYHTGKKWNHPTAPIYSAMANEYEKIFCDLLHSDYEYFADYVGD